MTLLKRLFLGASAALSLGGAAHAEPALWVAKSGNATVYLFGTVHVLKKETAWRSPKIASALASASDVWLEATDLDDAAKLQPIVMKLGTDPQHPLSTKVPAADLPKLDTAAKALGAPGEAALEPLQPWLAAVSISVGPLLKAGYDPNSGVDKLIKADATAAGKTLHGFETAEGQLNVLAGMPTALQVEFLESVLDQVDDGPKRIDELVAMWSKGDVEALGKLENEELAVKQPEIYRLLVVNRNRAWTDALVERLKTPGISFVAVGAAHLAGKDSVQTMLTARGVKVERQ